MAGDTAHTRNGIYCSFEKTHLLRRRLATRKTTLILWTNTKRQPSKNQAELCSFSYEEDVIKLTGTTHTNHLSSIRLTTSTTALCYAVSAKFLYRRWIQLLGSQLDQAYEDCSHKIINPVV